MREHISNSAAAIPRTDEPSSNGVERAPASTAWVLFWLLTGVYLMPVWFFPRVPTQDGISHVYNAVILRDFHDPGTRYDEVLAIRREQFPNWSAHLLLWGLTTVFPPLIAEKMLVSLYVVGMAAAVQLLVRAVNPGAASLAPAALLFLYHRGFFMGFYGFCLSLVLFWFVTGLSARWSGEFNATRAFTLAALLLISYFTHLIGFALALLSAAWISLVASRNPLKSLSWVAAAAIPGALLTGDYLISSRAELATDTGVWKKIVTWQTENLDWAHVGNELSHVNDELFGVVEPFSIPMVGPMVLLLVEFIALGGLVLGKSASTRSPATLVRWALLGLGVAVASLYLLLPDKLVPHGTYLQLRWAAIPPVLWLVCCRLPHAIVLRRSVIAAIWSVTAVHLIAVGIHFQRCNRDLAEYCSGIQESGNHRLLLPVQPASPELVDHISHASAYYCLATGNVLVDNYEAYNPYFPVRFAHPPARRGRSVDEYIGEFQPEVLVLWKHGLQQLRDTDREKYREVFRQGRLTIARRIPSPEEREVQ